jgi:hypothetical protein
MTVARALGMEQFAPVITPDLATKISTAYFYHHDVDNLEEGVQPFVTPAWDPQQRQGLMVMMQASDSLQDGASATLQDIMALKNLARISPPATVLQMYHTGQSFRVLLSMILGTAHPHATKFGDFLYHLGRMLPELEALAMRRAHTPLRIVRYIQLRFSNWMNQQLNSQQPVPEPNYHELLDRIRNQEAGWEPQIPYRYLPTGQPGNPTPSPTGGQPSGAAPAPSPAPGPPAAPTGQPQTGARTRVSNTKYDGAAYQQYRDKNMPLAQVRTHAKDASDPIPKNDQGTEVCLSYHVMGFCWSNCSRIGDHRPQTAGERTRTMKWCSTHFV